MLHSDFCTPLTNKHFELSHSGAACQQSQYLQSLHGLSNIIICVHAVNNINDSWAEIKESTMHDCWKRLCPDLVLDFKGFEETPKHATKEVVHLMNELN
jgi:hypothetical protein